MCRLLSVPGERACRHGLKHRVASANFKPRCNPCRASRQDHRAGLQINEKRDRDHPQPHADRDTPAGTSAERFPSWSAPKAVAAMDGTIADGLTSSEADGPIQPYSIGLQTPLVRNLPPNPIGPSSALPLQLKASRSGIRQLPQGITGLDTASRPEASGPISQTAGLSRRLGGHAAQRARPYRVSTSRLSSYPGQDHRCDADILPPQGDAKPFEASPTPASSAPPRAATKTRLVSPAPDWRCRWRCLD